MDDLESCLLIFNIGIAGYVWIRWYIMLGAVDSLVSPFSIRQPLLAVPVVGMVALFVALQGFASFDVQDSPTYLFFYVVMGAAWVGLAAVLFPMAGITVRDDVIDRRNRSATFALTGAVVGLTLAFIGGNIGDGPGWWAVVHSAGMSTIGLFVVWLVLELLTQASQIVTLERDVSAGLRLGSFLIAAGIILGRAAAGDYFSFEQMTGDFLSRAWPVIPLLLLAAIIEISCRPTVEQPNRNAIVFGLFPALIYLAGGVLVLGWAGPVL